MSRISTKNIGTSTNKILAPGVNIVKINTITMDKFPFKKNPTDPDAYFITLGVEGENPGTDFEGFYLDKNDPSKGRYNGPIGNVRSGEWAFQDGTTKGGIKVSRDKEILRFLQNTCKELEITNWLDNQDKQHETVESMIDQFSKDKPFKDKWMKMCIWGKEYVNKQNYTNYELFLPRFNGKEVPFELITSKGHSRLIQFDKELHIKPKKKLEPIKSFGDDTTQVPPDGDFQL